MGNAVNGSLRGWRYQTELGAVSAGSTEPGVVACCPHAAKVQGCESNPAAKCGFCWVVGERQLSETKEATEGYDGLTVEGHRAAIGRQGPGLFDECHRGRRGRLQRADRQREPPVHGRI